MPETSMHENNLLPCCEYNVRPAWQVFLMESVAIAEPVQQATNDHLGSRVFPAYAGHVVTPLLRV